MFKAKGKLAILSDNRERVITMDKGKLSGDMLFLFELKFVLDDMQKNGEPIMPAMYYPKGNYYEDEIAVALTIRRICTSVKFKGDVPVLKSEENEEEGKIY